ncbi:hypothetical protein ACIQB4_28130 [Streptomyces griseoluteus]|uniref:hypothetical protein n=1 Tax=Streptomyces griseoluteus TaxID=29306 RepID=UPI003807F12B
MLALEKTLLDTAEKLELIDFIQRKQLERIRDDRHLCAHPSVRPLGELYEPTMEYARAHLVAALEAVLIHPPSQGRKIVGSFLKHVVDPGYVYDTEYLTHTFFDRVRPSARSKVVEAAAKFAVLAIEDPGTPTGWPSACAASPHATPTSSRRPSSSKWPASRRPNPPSNFRHSVGSATSPPSGPPWALPCAIS